MLYGGHLRRVLGFSFVYYLIDKKYKELARINLKGCFSPIYNQQKRQTQQYGSCFRKKSR